MQELAQPQAGSSVSVVPPGISIGSGCSSLFPQHKCPVLPSQKMSREFPLVHEVTHVLQG
ncbi:UNVERIFIED_CONTAM: hypothetical protein Slati_1519400 [Sesamum latifolium]|uniref:Uncharacterized protein n=1 Tax=Sesamum latifolium TaxID=2727402 RepID=A0AAW2X812_9LAMI